LDPEQGDRHGGDDIGSEFVAEKVIEGLGADEIIGGLRELPAVVERLNEVR